MTGRILVVEDDVAMAQVLREGLARRGFSVVTEHGGAAALVAMQTQDFDVIVTDLNMKGIDGLTLCERIVAASPGTPVIVITAFGSLEVAIKAIRAGAYDFLTKPFELDALAIALTRAVQHRRLRDEVVRLRDEVQQHTGASGLLGSSQAVSDLRALVARLVDSDASVLLSGESGTGKEVVARTIHQQGRRRAGPFVAVNCAAMPEALLESELFGHAKGAFTDAHQARTGLFVQAQGGTLFLDEVGELPLGLQPKLLRALQERRVRPVGGNQELPFDARIVTATNKDLEAAVAGGRFREDLYFRINVITVPVPPLRARGNDVLLFAQHFLKQFSVQSGKPVVGLAPATAERLLAWDWPGNVRELKNVIERAVTLTRFDRLTPDDLPEKLVKPRAAGASGPDTGALLTVDEVEKRHILKVLERLGGHRTQAATVLGLDRKTLYRKLERYGYDDGVRDAGSAATSTAS